MEPVSMGLYLGTSAALKAFSSWRERKKQRESQQRAIKQLEQSKARLGGQNRAAYSDALAFMASNRENPNAWNFAANTYNARLSGAMEQERRYTDAQTDLMTSMPARQSLFDLAADIGSGAANAYAYSRMFGDGTGESAWSLFRRKKPIVSLTPNDTSFENPWGN